MVMMAFQESTVGQRRYIVRDLVGGRRLRTDPVEGTSTLVSWCWPQGDQKLGRLVTTDVAATAPAVPEGDGALPEGVVRVQTFPPDGGLGLVARARWGWLPIHRQRGEDELYFPRNAEIREVEEVNDEWYVGSYMGDVGLFPAPYVRLFST